jgi:RND superfamily putative drug exporter
MFERLGRSVVRHWALVLAGWIAFAALVNWFAPAWDSVTYDGDLAYLPATMTSVRGEKLLAAAFPAALARSQVVIVVERPDGPLRAEDFAVSDALAAHFEPFTDQYHGEAVGATAAGQPRPGIVTTLPIVDVWNYRSEVTGKKLVSPTSRNGQATLVVLQLANEFMATHNIEVLHAVESVLAQTRGQPSFPPGLNLGLTGSAAVGGDMLDSATESINNTELTTVFLVVGILLVVYRAPLLVVVPLAAIVISTLAAMDLVAIATQFSSTDGWFHFKVFKTTKIFIVTILFGSGTDYCLFLISRYREELNRGLDRARALTVTTSQVGTALAASALTTIFGLAMMYFSDFGKFRYSGPIIAVCLTICLVACLTLAPALLQALGLFVFWPFHVGKEVQTAAHPRATHSRYSRLWQRISQLILARPGMILVGSVALMLYPATAGWSIPISYNLVNELRSDRTSVLGTNMFRRHFPAGETGPLTIVAYQRQGGFDTKPGEHKIAILTKLLHDTEGVVSVRSLSEPLGDRPGLFNPLSPRGRRKMAAKRHRRTLATYLSQAPEYQGQITRFDLILAYDPFSPRATEVLNRLDSRLQQLSQDPSSAWHGAQFDFTGTTAAKRDLQTVIESDQVRIMQTVTVAVLAVILVLLRRPLICFYLIVSVIFSYLVTIGCTELFFAWLYAGTFEGLDWKVPIFLFVILVAVGQDYNIYLVTRVFEEQQRHPAIEGLRRAVVQTGGIITSCGIIMAGSFMSMLTGSLRGMLELGFALTLGIVLDTFVVRPILVPAFLVLLYRWQEPKQQVRPTRAVPASPCGPSASDFAADDLVEEAAAS